MNNYFPQIMLCGAFIALLSGSAELSNASPYISTFVPPPMPSRDDGAYWSTGKGVRCGRKGDRLFVLGPKRSLLEFDMRALARKAIERDVIHPWDGSWDVSLMVDTGIVFDRAGRAYTLIIPRYSNLRHAVLLWSTDGCRNWQARALTGVNATMEKPDGFNDKSGAPTILSYQNYGSTTGTRLWLDLLGEDMQPIEGSPFVVADNSLLSANHSGGGNSTFKTLSSVFVVYPTTDKSAKGTLSMARRFDLKTKKWDGTAVPIERSTTKIGPDLHDLPAITMGKDRRAIVVIGAHHALFRILTARKPENIAAGWSPPIIIGDPAQGPPYREYSYVSLNLSLRGTLNIVARAEGRWGYYDLVQFRKSADGQWTDWPGARPHRIIASPRRTGYIAWRQRISMAPDGRLTLSFAYFPNRLTSSEATALGLSTSDGVDCRPMDVRCWYPNSPTLAPRTIVSTDDGLTWH